MQIFLIQMIFLFKSKIISNKILLIIQKKSPFYLHKNTLRNNMDAAETAIQIIATKQLITNPALCHYLKERNINKNIADAYCHEVKFRLNHCNDRRAR